MTDFRTPLSKVRGLGAAKSGVGHFIGQRISAIALAVLMPIFLFSIASNVGGGYEQTAAFLGSPFGAILTLLAMTAALYHMRLGLQTVVEDYIHKPATKAVLLIGNTFICAGLWLAVLYSILALAS
jgi:succinate dehydrogenase / fumarate reductase membrane anchor subunit